MFLSDGRLRRCRLRQPAPRWGSGSERGLVRQLPASDRNLTWINGNIAAFCLFAAGVESKGRPQGHPQGRRFFASKASTRSRGREVPTQSLPGRLARAAFDLTSSRGLFRFLASTTTSWHRRHSNLRRARLARDSSCCGNSPGEAAAAVLSRRRAAARRHATRKLLLFLGAGQSGIRSDKGSL
jgi:hypothetical protein